MQINRTFFLFGLMSVFTLLTKAQSGDADTTLYSYKSGLLYKTFTKESRYITMPDGVKLAVDIYKPKGVSDTAKFPSLLYQTRYYRSVHIKWPFNWFFKVIPSTKNFDLKEFIRNGYVLVCADVRGTGASYGSRSLSMPDTNEIKDGAHLVDWMLTQSWCNGKVGALGISYIGITAEYLAMNCHPALKAIAPLFTPFDLYDDVGMPGGVFAEKFLFRWNEACKGLDRGQLPLSSRSKWIKLVVSGVGRVPPNGKKKLKEAISEHEKNFYQTSDGHLLEYMDDSISKDGKMPRQVFQSPHLCVADINSNKIAVFSYTGWWDVGFTKGGIRQFLNYSNPDNKLNIGPWNHGGVNNMSRHSFGLAQYNHVADVMSFFDYHLKGKRTGMESRLPVKYFTIGKEKWNYSSYWPPVDTIHKRFFTLNSGLLSQIKNSENSPSILSADSTFGTGKISRWSLRATRPQDSLPNFSFIEKRTLCFESESLEEPMEVTGHPIIHAKVSSSNSDGAIFAYVLEKTPDNKLHYVTEGHLRLVHRKTHTQPVYYRDAVLQRSYNRSDAQPMPLNKFENVLLDLFPISYQFSIGSKIVLAFSTNDSDYFKNITPQDSKFLISPETFIELPVMKD